MRGKGYLMSDQEAMNEEQISDAVNDAMGFNPLEAMRETAYREINKSPNSHEDMNNYLPEKTILEDGPPSANSQMKKRNEEEPHQDEEEEEDPPHLKFQKSFSRLAKKDASIRKRERELADRERRLEGVYALAEELERDPAAAIARLGIDPDKIYMNQVERQREEEESRIRYLEGKIEDLHRSMDYKHRQMEVRAKGNQWEDDFEEDFDRDEFSAVKSWDPSGNMIRKMVADRYRKTGKLMSPGRALEIFKERIEERLSRINGAHKPSGAQRGKTLTPAMGESPARASFGHLSDEEDMERITRKYMDLMR